MCMHDDDLDRTTTGTGAVLDYTYSELMDFDIDYGNDIQDYPNLKIPTLIEFLNTCIIYKCIPVIEIKKINDPAALLSTIEECGMLNRCIISGGIEDLKSIRALNTNIPLMVVGYSNKPYTFYTDLIQQLPENSGILYDYHSVDKAVVDELREKGIKAGLLKVRVFRPFPADEIVEALKGQKAIAVLDKSDSLNAAGGALFEDVVSSMYTKNVNVPTVNYVYGIGGRDTTSEDLEKVYTDLQKIAEDGKVENPYRYLGVRGDN